MANRSTPSKDFIVSIFHNVGQRLIPHYILAVPGDKVEPPSSEYFKPSTLVPPGCVVTREYGSPELTLWDQEQLVKDSVGILIPVFWKERENGTQTIIFRESLDHGFELPNDENLFRYSDLFYKRVRAAHREAAEKRVDSGLFVTVLKQHQKTLHDVEEVCAGHSKQAVYECAQRYRTQRKARRMAELRELKALASANTASETKKTETPKGLEATSKVHEKPAEAKTASEVSERQVKVDAESQVSEVQKVHEPAATKASTDTSSQEPHNR
ncbi:hypothetical protein CYMTET_42625 [Cymbomonas tetramitiformis]|uniref:Uncharacterized protein n=1 Tax=Cymbomonas tetramitiformis TaxID=36881 RepID=A0AAE0C5H3_9CHLO|nr:hypothetical protein CYMTET_42625 [Cymbomonas tetramitiformis]